MNAQASTDPRGENADTAHVAHLIEQIEQLRLSLDASAEDNLDEMKLMWLFADRRPRTVGEVADELALEQSDAEVSVKAAMSRRLLCSIRTESGQPDLFTPTDEGLDQHRRFVEHTAEVYRAGLAALDVSPQTFATMMRIVDTEGDLA